MARRTTATERREFYVRHRMGQTYQEIADSEGVSHGCVRHWCRRQRDGGECQTRYRQGPRGLLSHFDPKVRYCVLRLRLEHPRWGPNRILAKLEKRASLQGLRLPSEASIGRYLHQWPQFRRRAKQVCKRERPQQPTEVHQRWQLDFKLGTALNSGIQVNLHTARDPVGEVCIDAHVFPAGPVGRKGKKPTLKQVRSGLRRCFSRWGTLPDEIQTDGEAILIGQPQDTFPSTFTLWLTGLDIKHLVTRPGKPTDNAEVERCHRTVNDYAIVGNEDASYEELQHILDQAVHELAYELPSRAKGCGGHAPVKAHPELLWPRRPYQADHEMELFDLRRVDAYLATFTWERKVGKSGQITIGGQHQTYSVGRSHARHQVLVRFDPGDRHFVFYDADAPDEEIGRRPARGLDAADLMGRHTSPSGPDFEQLRLPLRLPKGVDC